MMITHACFHARHDDVKCAARLSAACLRFISVLSAAYRLQYAQLYAEFMVDNRKIPFLADQSEQALGLASVVRARIEEASD